MNLLHYCRLIYKFVTFMKETYFLDENISKILSSWVLSLMVEIKGQINDNKILYEGENGWLREKGE